jgi:L-ascorbate metabolism protein UlaG (beta-lactamase superfamily)
MASGLLERLAARLAREPGRGDAAVTAERRWSRLGAALPPGLELQWLGTAGFRLAYQGTQLLIDPYVTRPGLRSVLWRRPLLPSEALVARHLPAADAVLVGHTHFDHAMDVPLVARRAGCPVYGSSSLRQLMALHGLAHRFVETPVHRPFAVGPFEITFVPSVHSKLLLGLKVPADGELTCDALDRLGGGAYRCGQVYGIHLAVGGITLYHQGSADLLDDEVRHHGIDIFLCGIAGRSFSRRYVERVLRALAPRVVVAHHHDDFFRPLDAPMGFSLNVSPAGFVEEVARVSREFEVLFPAPLETVAGAAASVRSSPRSA